MHITFFLVKLSAFWLLALFIFPGDTMGMLLVLTVVVGFIVAVLEILLLAAGITYWQPKKRGN